MRNVWKAVNTGNARRLYGFTNDQFTTNTKTYCKGVAVMNTLFFFLLQYLRFSYFASKVECGMQLLAYVYTRLGSCFERCP